jgi:hypothetical protein
LASRKVVASRRFFFARYCPCFTEWISFHLFISLSNSLIHIHILAMNCESLKAPATLQAHSE